MEFDEMQRLWQDNDAKRIAPIQVSMQLLEQASRNVVETKLGGFGRILCVEIALNALVLIFIGGFAADHLREFPVVAAAVALDAYFAVILAAAVGQYVMLRRIDYNAALVITTGCVQQLRFMRAQSQMWILIVAPLLWLPMLIVALRAFFGINPLTAFGPVWTAANLAFGVAVLSLAILWAKQPGSGRIAGVLGRVADSLAGNELRAAAEKLDWLRRYNAETDQ